MSTFAPPDAVACTRTAELAVLIRCFDRNEGRGFFLPDENPHGVAWSVLSDGALREMAQWCMLPEYHERLRLERLHRAGRLIFDPFYASAPGTQYTVASGHVRVS